MNSEPVLLTTKQRAALGDVLDADVHPSAVVIRDRTTGKVALVVETAHGGEDRLIIDDLAREPDGTYTFLRRD